MKKFPVLALLSDIHANIDALEAVLEDLDGQGVDKIFCLGDIIGYGPEPRRCVQLVRERCEASLMGNHEAMALHLSHDVLSELPAEISAPLILARRELKAEEQHWLKSLPMVIKADPVEAVHSSLEGPAQFPYISSFEEAEAHFRRQSRGICFHGHTHLPVVWVAESGSPLRLIEPGTKPIPLPEGPRYAVNVGSVGQPRDGSRNACYAIYDPNERILTYRSVPYNLVACRWRFEKTKLPKANFQRLLGVE
jgi:predicted phosphodiesterase